MKDTCSKKSLVLSPLHKAQRQVSLYLDQMTKPIGLAGHEVHLLAYVLRYGPCPIKELSRVFGQKPSTLTGILDRLEARSAIVREPHPNDRRSVRIAAGTGAANLVESCGEKVSAMEDDICMKVSEEQLAGFHAVLQAIGEITGIDVRASGPEDA